MGLNLTWVLKKSGIISLCHLEKDMALKSMKQEGSNVMPNGQHISEPSCEEFLINPTFWVSTYFFVNMFFLHVFFCI